MKRLLAILLLAASGLMAQPQSDTWEAGEVDPYDPTKSSGLLRGSLLVVNRCCKGEHQFEVSSRSPWIIIHPTDALFVLGDGAQRFVHPGLDSRNLPPGNHEATINVNCATCDPGLCDYDVKLRLTVRTATTTGGTRTRSTGGTEPGTTGGTYVLEEKDEPCTPPPNERVKEGAAKKSCKFEGVYTTKPIITIVSNISGQFSDEASRNALGKMADALGDILNWRTRIGASNRLRRRESNVGDAVGLGTDLWNLMTGDNVEIPTDLPEAAGILGKKALKELQGAMDAMNRVVGERGNKSVDLFAQIPIQIAEYECTEMERCEQGYWQSIGVTNIPEKIPLQSVPRTKTLTINLADPTDSAQKFNELDKWLESQTDLPALEQRMKIFESLGPCPACDPPAPGGGVSPPDDPPGGRSCQPILREINEIQELIFDLQAEIDESRRKLQQIPGQRQALDTRCDAEQRRLNSELSDASAEVNRALGALGTARDAKRDTQAPERALKAAEAKRDAAEKAANDHRQQCNQERQRLENEERRLNDLISRSQATLDELHVRLRAKQREYEDCLRGK